MNAARVYQRTQVMTASRERALVLLFDAAEADLRGGTEALLLGQGDHAARQLGRAHAIVTELLDSLQHHAAPALCKELSDVYVFVLGRILKARACGDAQPCKEALRVLSPVADAFRTLAQAAAVGP